MMKINGRKLNSADVFDDFLLGLLFVGNWNFMFYKLMSIENKPRKFNTQINK